MWINQSLDNNPVDTWINLSHVAAFVSHQFTNSPRVLPRAFHTRAQPKTFAFKTTIPIIRQRIILYNSDTAMLCAFLKIRQKQVFIWKLPTHQMSPINLDTRLLWQLINTPVPHKYPYIFLYCSCLLAFLVLLSGISFFFIKTWCIPSPRSL